MRSHVLFRNTLFSTIISNSPSAIGYLSKVLIDRQKSMAKLESDHDLGRSALLKSNDPYGFRLRTDETHAASGHQLRFILHQI